MSEHEGIEKVALRPCRDCGCAHWKVWFSWTGAYVTAFAACEDCDALFFSSGEDSTEVTARKSLYGVVNNGYPPYRP